LQHITLCCNIFIGRLCNMSTTL